MVIFWQSLLHVLKSHIEIKQEVKLLSGEVTKKRVNFTPLDCLSSKDHILLFIPTGLKSSVECN